MGGLPETSCRLLKTPQQHQPVARHHAAIPESTSRVTNGMQLQ